MKTMNNFIISTVASIVLAGVEAKADFMQCIACPAGSKCDGINKSPCEAGTFSTGGASGCSQCPANTYSNAGASGCTTCPAGQTSTAGASSCFGCDAGQYASNGTCKACADGYYQPNKTQSSCISCDDLYVLHQQDRKNSFFGIYDAYFNNKKITYVDPNCDSSLNCRDDVKGIIFTNEGFKSPIYTEDPGQFKILSLDSYIAQYGTTFIKLTANELTNYIYQYKNKYQYLCLINHKEEDFDNSYGTTSDERAVIAQSDDGESLCLKDYTISCNKINGRFEIIGTDTKGQRSTISIATKAF